MEIYIINIILISFWALLIYLLKLHQKKIGKIIFLTLAISQLVLLQGLRSNQVGADTNVYLTFFNEAKYSNLETILDRRFELGYKLINKLLAEIGVNDQLFLLFISILILLPVAIFIYKHSPNVYLSVYFYITFGFYAASFNTLRQNLAYGIILLAFTFIIRRKFFPFLLMVTIASFFHASAWLFLPAYFLSRLKLTPLILSVIGIGSLVLFGLRTQIMDIVVSNIFTSYSITSTGAYSWFFFNILLFLFALLFYPFFEKKDGNEKYVHTSQDTFNFLDVTTIRMCYVLTLTGIVLMMFSTVAENVMRVANYYYLFVILLLPMVISSVKNKYIKAIVSMILFLGMGLVYIYLLSIPSGHNDTPYNFYWN